MRSQTIFKVAAAAGLIAAGVQAQRGGNPAEWSTAYGDAQRSSWDRSSTIISTEALGQPGFALQWKSRIDPAARNALLTQGSVATGVNIFTPLSVIAGPGNLVSAIDDDTGNIFWARHLGGAASAATPACPGGITGAPSRMVRLTVTPAPPGRAGRAGRVYSGAVGKPGEGVPIPLSPAGDGRGPAPAAQPPARPAVAPALASPAAAASPFPTNEAAVALASRGGGGLFRASPVVYVVSGDGMLHKLGLATGKDLQQPTKFVPPGAQFSDLIAVGDIIYTSTSAGCGGAPNGILALGAEDNATAVAHWNTNGGTILGPPAFLSSGTLIAAIGPATVKSGGYANAIVALDPKTLALKDWYTQPGFEFAAPPSLFQQDGHDIVAVATRDGRVLLLDGSSLGGADHATPLVASMPLTGGAKFSAHSAATWSDGSSRWLLAPVTGAIGSLPGAHMSGAVSGGAVLALKIGRQGGKFSVEPGWVSENVAEPLTPMIVNDAVFVASGASGAPPKLYALAGTTGRTLWQSANAIAAPVSGHSFWASTGQVYLGTTDGTVYAFGFDMERGPAAQRSGS